MSIKRKLKTLKRIYGQIDRYTKTDPRELNTTFAELERLARKESAKYIFNNIGKSVLFNTDGEYWSFLISKTPKEGLLLEFGVMEGRSINYLAEQLKKQNDDRIIYGLDSFEGLSEDWAGTQFKEGALSTFGKVPEVLPNVQLVKGWVDDTFLPFLEKIKKEDRKMAYVHLDMDVYTPTKFVLENILPYLVPGTIIDFDDLVGFPGWKEGEFKAMQECLDGRFKYEHIAFCELSGLPAPYRYIMKSAIRITEI